MATHGFMAGLQVARSDRIRWIVIGQARDRVDAVRYEVDGQDTRVATMYAIPGDDDWRAFVVPADDPGEGTLAALDARGEEMSRRSIRNPELAVRRMLEFRKSNERAQGTVADGT